MSTQLTHKSPRVAAARRLLRRKYRDATGLFLAEGPQAVREALRAGAVDELFGTQDALARHTDLAATADAGGATVVAVTEQALASLTETVTPQGVVATCRQLHHTGVGGVLDAGTSLVVVLAGIADPGNAGTVVRTADAAGAQIVVFPDGTVDPYNGKCVRASAGSLFHVDLVRGESALVSVSALREAGLRVLAADAHGRMDLYQLTDEELARPTAWLFGSEAHGLDAALAAQADALVRVPIYGQAESLNLAAAAAVCLYASAKARAPQGVGR